jgi:pyruvate/2-oxoacid:ferredoxin oxidoreductase alpha subunit
MHEMLHYASGCRAPVVMVCVNRSLAAPWAFWSDQTDSLSQRDTGWIQYYPENNQDVVDTIVQAYRVAEEVLLPVMVNMEANFVSHFMEPVDIPAPEVVDAFLPSPSLPQRFETDAPGFVIPTVNQTQFQHFRRLADEAMAYAGKVIERVDRDFAGRFGRGYGTLETVQCEDADLVLVTTGTITSTARTALKKLRADGLKVGLLKLKVFRPFPVDALLAVLPPRARIAVIERNLSLGREGIFCSELKATLANSREPRWVQGYLAGIGGTNVNPELIERVVKDALKRTEPQERPIWVTEDEL